MTKSFSFTNKIWVITTLLQICLLCSKLPFSKSLERQVIPFTHRLFRESSVCAVVSFAPFDVRKPRQSYKTLLLYWPHNWNIQFHMDKQEKKFEECLKESTFPPKMTVEENFPKRKREKSITHFGRNHWKFYLDKYVQEDIIALIDDDACLLTKLSYEDILTKGGKLATRSIIPSSKDENFIKGLLGWKFVGKFMTDFPVFIWKDMIPDIREAVVQSTPEEYNTFPSAFEWLLRQSNDTQKFSEFTLMLNFAYSSDKWKHRYNWQVYDIEKGMENPFIFGMSTHQHSTGICWNSYIDIPEKLFVYPYNLQYKYDRGNHMFGRRSWAYKPLYELSKKDQLPPLEYIKIRKNIFNTTLSRVDIHPEIMSQWNKCFSKANV